MRDVASGTAGSADGGDDMDPVPETAQVLDDMIKQGRPGLAIRLYRMAMDAYVERDADLAGALNDMDDRLDQIHHDFIQALPEGYQTAIGERGQRALPIAARLMRARICGSMREKSSCARPERRAG